MPRPRKHRRLRRAPQPVVFKPVGIPLESLECVILLHEEMESLRLSDLEGCYQEEAAEEMGVSRSTFQRMLAEARRKVAQALVNGAALRVEGGDFRVEAVRWRCADCGHKWDVAHGSGQGEPDICPVCGSRAVRERAGRRRRHSK